MTAPVPFIPREYQRIAADFLLRNPRCALFAVPGLGKTATVYMVLDLLKLAGSNFFPALVIAPKKVAELVWSSEQKKWGAFADLRVVPILGERDVRDAALLRRGDVYVINYDSVQWLVQTLGKRWPFKTVIADESTRLKNFRLSKGDSTKRSQALSDISQHTGRWINLTGTPAPNGLKDLWGQMWFIDFGQRLGRTYTAFLERWFYINAYDRTIQPRKGAEVEIYAAIADVTLALRAEDWMDIRKLQVLPREVDLPPAARKLYDAMERDFFAELANVNITAATAAAKSTKLLQMTSGAVYDSTHQTHHLHDAKIEGLRSLINDLAGEPLLLAYWWQFEPPMLKAAFPEIRFMKTKKDQDDWNAGKIQLMGVHPGSAGHGIDLQHGGRAIAFFTQTWDLELREQVFERIGPVRQKQAGFDRVVLLYDIIARDTLDVEVLERTASKRSVQDALMLARSHRRGDALAGLL